MALFLFILFFISSFLVSLALFVFPSLPPPLMGFNPFNGLMALNHSSTCPHFGKH